MPQVKLEVVQEDALNIEADVLALKFAQDFYGVDLAVGQKLGVVNNWFQLREGEFRFEDDAEVLNAREVLFLGVRDLFEFRYREIRLFAKNVLEVLRAERPSVRTVA